MSFPIHHPKWIAEFYARPSTLLSGDTPSGEAKTSEYHPEDIVGKAGLYAADVDKAHELLIQHLLDKGYTLITLNECEKGYLRRERLGHDWVDHRLKGELSYENPVEFSYKSAAELNLSTGSTGDGNTQEDYLVITEHEIKPLAEDPTLSFWEQPWIDDELKSLLFGASETEQVTAVDDKSQREVPVILKTYLILDAAARKRVTKVFDIDEIPYMGVEIECLFKGEAAETYEEVAPYLVDMTLPEGAWDDADLVPEFHKDFFKKHWDKREGIFVRSTASLDELKQHFRKFTQIQDEAGKWYWFRFWDSKHLYQYTRNITTDKERACRWFMRFTGESLEYYIPKPYSHQISCLQPATILIRETTNTPFILKDEDIGIFVKKKKAEFLSKLRDHLCSCSKGFASIDETMQFELMDKYIHFAKQHDITIEKAIADISKAIILNQYPLTQSAKLVTLLQSDRHQLDRARLILAEVTESINLSNNKEQ